MNGFKARTTHSLEVIGETRRDFELISCPLDDERKKWVLLFSIIV